MTPCTLLVILTVLLALGAPVAAQEQGYHQNYPARQIDLVVPFPPGGGADVGARMVAQIASENWVQPIIIQNKAGATGAIGSEYVARATATRSYWQPARPTPCCRLIAPIFPMIP
jgi:tripartite-type tricarboxylate transporter receptor subunit TctC